jgi:hypothetical protein
MKVTVCPHCGAQVSPIDDAFCSECRGDLSEPLVNPVVSGGNEPTKSVAAQPPGLPLGRICGGIGVLVGIASTVLSLGGAGGEGRGNLAFLSGYACGSAAVLGLIGLAFGAALGYFIRSASPRKTGE